MRRLAWPVALAAPVAAHAHSGEAHGQSAPWFDPVLAIPLALLLAMYAIGLWRLSRRSTRGWPRLRRDALLFLCGWSVLAGSVLSGLHAAGERSFALHMVEHELIMLVAALLLAVSAAGPVLLWSLPGDFRRRFGLWLNGAPRRGWDVLVAPWTATLLQAGVLLLWHVPALFDRALASEGWHVAQHFSFVLSAILFWRAMALAAARGEAGVAAVCLLATATVGMGLGALMALSGSPWYQGYAALGLDPGGLSPAEDQQLAGLIMWIPGGMVHLGAACVILYRWLRGGTRHAVAA